MTQQRRIDRPATAEQLVSSYGSLRSAVRTASWDQVDRLADQAATVARRNAGEAAAADALDLAAEQRHRRQSTDLIHALRRMSEQAEGRDLLTKTADAAGAATDADPDFVAGLRQLATGAGNADNPLLTSLHSSQLYTRRAGRAMVRTGSVGLGTRALLSRCHAAFNTAYLAADPASGDQAIAALSGEVAKFVDQLRATQAQLHQAAGQPGFAAALSGALDSIAAAAPSFAGSIAAGARALREHDLPAAAEPNLAASSAVREAVSTYSACLNLIADGSAAATLPDPAAVALNADCITFGSDADAAGLGQLADGTEVVVFGRVDAARAWHPHGQQRLQSTITMTCGSTPVTVLAPYFHPRHRGITTGGYARLAGTWRTGQADLGGAPAVVLDRMALSGKAKTSWWLSLLAQSGDYFSLWPDGYHIAWALSPHIPAAANQASNLGAGECIYPPLVRGWTKDYAHR